MMSARGSVIVADMLSETVHNVGTPPEEVTIRDASPGDAELLAWVMLTASRSHLRRGIWEYILGYDEEHTLDYLQRLAVTERVHLFHWSRFLVAETAGQPVAALCGYDPTVHGMTAYFEAAFPLVASMGIGEEELAGMLARGEVIRAVESGHPHGMWAIENVATLPGHRRRGFATRLLDAVVDRGRLLGFRGVQIPVLIGNEPARAAYVKHGFEPAGRHCDDAFEDALGSPGMEVLRRRLDG